MSFFWHVFLIGFGLMLGATVCVIVGALVIAMGIRWISDWEYKRDAIKKEKR